MGKINILSFEVANLIAAGEVVDRPASAIKEMIENSIDAGARHITVEIQNGGITLMRISDDGCGMDSVDLPLAVKRHATSKIKTAEDLDGIYTLGFRGEALAAIAAVSKLRIISKTRDNPLGAELIMDCGEIVEFNERGCSDGTTIIVEELFANVPARRKFLKRDVTETTAVCANVERIALSHPEIAFRLICDGQVKLETAGDGKLLNTIYSVFGRDFANRLIEVDGDFDGISVKGYVGRSDNVKGNRNYENFYINKRFVKSRTASAAIEQAFVSYMASERFPVCVLFISLNPMKVDVNVHPAKLEVKFTNEKPVFEAVYYAVRHALEENTKRPEIGLQKQGMPRMSEAFVPVERGESLKARQISISQQIPVQSAKPAAEQKPRVEIPATQSAPVRAATPVAEDKSVEDKDEKPFTITAEEYIRNYLPDSVSEEKNIKILPEEITRKTSEVSEKTVENEKQVTLADNHHSETVETPSAPTVVPKVEKIDYRIIGEAFNAYIIVEVGEKILLIDKHAAHERIIFEQMKRNMYEKDATSQLLMLPIEVMLMTDEVAAVEEYRSELEAVGFEFTSSRNTVQITALPVGIEQDAAEDMLTVIADRVKSGTGSVNVTRNIVFEKALYQASCKAAIKAGREYASGHQKWIVEKLMEIPDVTVCPHGRPVAMELSKRNIDHQFNRV